MQTDFRGRHVRDRGVTAPPRKLVVLKIGRILDHETEATQLPSLRYFRKDRPESHTSRSKRAVLGGVRALLRRPWSLNERSQPTNGVGTWREVNPFGKESPQLVVKWLPECEHSLPFNLLRYATSITR
jgi:hypothetical protein